MKKLLYIATLIPFLALAQSQDQNYIKTTTYKKPTSQGTVDVTNPAEAMVQVSYFDGLGRPIQQVAHKQSNSGKDIITHIEYDSFGRQTKDYLPYPNATASLDYTNPTTVISDLTGFYGSYNEGTAYPFSQKKLEASPLNRVLKQAAPGDAWAMNNGKEIKFDYQYNSQDDQVRFFKAIATWNVTLQVYDISISSPQTYYVGNELYKTTTKDENWTLGKNNTTDEFKNKQGQVVLKRTYADIYKRGSLEEAEAVHDTYYIYDQYGNLTYVIPPLADGTSSQATLDNLGYQYKYDSRNRLVEKKLPGKQWEFIVYDKLDRPVATGPAFSPYGDTTVGWMITEYDVFGRVTQTGWKQLTVSATTRASNQSSVTSGSNPFVLSANDMLTKSYYDNYSYPNAPTIPSQIEGQNVVTNVKGLPTGTWTKVLDANNANAAETSYTLYDTYYRPIRTYTSNHLGGYTQVDSKLDWAGKTQYTITRHQYDGNSNVITVRDNFKYTDQDRLELHTQQINGGNEQLLAKNTYDELGQLTSKNVGGTDATGSTGLQNVDYTYNIRGWLKEINDVNTIGTDLFAFKINYNTPDEATPLYNGNISETFWKSASDNVKRKYKYSYDHLNRLLEANYSKPDNSSYTSGLDNYLEALSYDKNGNIQTLVRNGNLDTDGIQTVNQIDDLVYIYDVNTPNLLKTVMDKSTSPQGFSELFDSNSDGSSDTEEDYAYDANGNLTQDENKGITEILYNHLNLPIAINFKNGNTIYYIYNATGQKIVKIVNESSMVTTTEYLAGGFQYKGNILQFFPHAEGYVSVVDSHGVNNYNYVFNYIDHLGNIRLSYGVDPSTGGLKIMEENHYYAFGLKHTNYNSDQLLYQKNANDVVVLKGGTPTVQSTYKYKYNGKELQDELGLNTTAMDYRQYDSAIGRFNGMDKLSEMSHNITPYRFGFNNPAFWSDPTGLFESRKAARKYRREHGLKGRIRRAENGTFELYGKEGMVYSAGDDSPYASTDSNPNDGVIASHLAEGSVNESQKSNNNIGGIVSTGLWGVNTSVGFLSTGIAYKGQYHKMNELWHATKSSGVRFRWDSRWNNPMAKSWRATQVSKVAGVRNFSSKMTKVGGALLVADIALSGDIKPSHVINGIMLAASTTGVGTIVAAVWFIADFGTMGVNYLVNGEAKGIGDMIDESNFGKSATIKMYDGIY